MCTRGARKRLYSVVWCFIIIECIWIFDKYYWNIFHTPQVNSAKIHKKEPKITQYEDNLLDFIKDGEDLKILPSDEERKLILYWTKWYNPSTSWEKRFGTPEEYEDAGCTKYQCEFTYDRSRLKEAHALLFKSDGIDLQDLPERFPDQRWVWVDVESPICMRGQTGLAIVEKMGSRSFNWTMSYHTSSDILAMNGYLLPQDSSPMPLRASLLSTHKIYLDEYLAATAKNTSLEDIWGGKWLPFLKRPRPVVWMSSNCHTLSSREEYVWELNKYIQVDKYGECGSYKCGGRYEAFNTKCWVKKLRKNYLFGLAFENALCNHYLSEKPYNPLVHGLIPIVWGGDGYELFLPPGSYIDARQYHPRDLADLLQKLQTDYEASGRYFVWRKYWKVMVRGSFCELCHRLHTDPVRGHHQNISAWRYKAENCFVPDESMFHFDAWRRIIHPKN